MPPDSQLASIRPMEEEDAEAVARLSGELGYPATPEDMRKRIRAIAGVADHAAWVACVGDEPVGWIHANINWQLQSGRRGEITGLVVSDRRRSSGIGRRLVRQAEEWLADQGVAEVVVRSQMKREAAHRFYQREGYSLVKTSAVFSKKSVG